MRRGWVEPILLAAALSSAIALAGRSDPNASSTETRLERLSWLAGTWVSDTAGTRSEEHWMTPAGGVMVGMSREVQGGRLRSFEFLRIRENGDTIAYLASPGGRSPATPFFMTELGDRRVTFENLAHDFPQRISYRLGDDGLLRARVEGKVNGRLESEDYRWRRGG